MYKHRPTTLQALREAVTQEVAAIPIIMTRRCTEKFRDGVHQCVNNDGRHSADLNELIQDSNECIFYK